MKKNDLVYLHHILNSIERIEEYTEGMEKENFLSRNLVQEGTIRQIEIIGEATKIYPFPRAVSSSSLERYCRHEGSADSPLFWGKFKRRLVYCEI